MEQESEKSLDQKIEIRPEVKTYLGLNMTLSKKLGDKILEKGQAASLEYFSLKLYLVPFDFNGY